MTEPYSIFIPCAVKDFHKLKFLLRSIELNLTGYDDITICAPCPEKWPEMGLSSVSPDIRSELGIREDKIVLDIDLSIFSHRPNWIYQQFLKLFQNVTEHDLFLTIDADVIFNRPLPLFNDAGKRIWYHAWPQNHQPYYEFNERTLGLGREYNGTFLCDMNFFDRKIIQEIVLAYGGTQEEFIWRSAAIIDSDCYPSEADLYGQYCYKYHPDLYEIREAKSYAEGRIVYKHDDQVWPDDHIQQTIDELKIENIDIIMLHSWHTSNEVVK